MIKKCVFGKIIFNLELFFLKRACFENYDFNVALFSFATIENKLTKNTEINFFLHNLFRKICGEIIFWNYQFFKKKNIFSILFRIGMHIVDFCSERKKWKKNQTKHVRFTRTLSTKAPTQKMRHPLKRSRIT